MDPAIRWSVTSLERESTDQGLDRSGPDTRRRPEDQSANRRDIAWWGPEVVSGVDPSYSVLLWCCLAQDLYPSAELSGVGGDEETRTPDPLLAKETLCQLSYVPIATREGGGGRFWTRTRDLCLIRAVL